MHADRLSHTTGGPSGLHSTWTDLKTLREKVGKMLAQKVRLQQARQLAEVQTCPWAELGFLGMTPGKPDWQEVGETFSRSWDGDPEPVLSPPEVSA